MLSPTLFSIYVQDLLDELQNLGVGFHVGNTFLGAIAWAEENVRASKPVETEEQLARLGLLTELLDFLFTD